MRVNKRVELLKQTIEEVDKLTLNYQKIEEKLTEIEEKLGMAEDSASELKTTVKKATTTKATTKKVVKKAETKEGK